MLNATLLRKDIYSIAKKLNRREFILDIDFLTHKEEERKKLQIITEKLQSKRNAYSKEIGKYKSKGQDIKALYKKVLILGDHLKYYKRKLNSIRNIIHNYALSIPNIPDDSIPDGKNKKDNIEIMRWGKPKTYNFPIRDHIVLGQLTDGLDFKSAAKITGSRFSIMHGKIARLHRALSQFMLDFHVDTHGYQEYYLPYLVNKESLYGTGQLPKFYEDLFHIQSVKNIDNTIKTEYLYTLIPTAEVPLTNLIRYDIIEENCLPIKITANTPCFRSEAGAYGQDTRGLIRVHQFEKVELVQIVQPDQSDQALEEITQHAEKILQMLNLPYRKVLLCAGDLAFSSCKTYDLEVWLPGKNMYCEISSCSNNSDFQARRMQARYRTKSGKINFLHTLNASGLAVGRTLVAILENYQLSDGSIEVPMVLRPYMKGLIYINIKN